MLQLGNSLILGGCNLETPLKDLETKGSLPTGWPEAGSRDKVEETALR